MWTAISPNRQSVKAFDSAVLLGQSLICQLCSLIAISNVECVRVRTDRARSMGRESFSVHVIVSLEIFDIFLSWNVQVASSHHCLNKATVNTAMCPFTSTALHSSSQTKHCCLQRDEERPKLQKCCCHSPLKHSLSLLFFISIMLSIQSFTVEVHVCWTGVYLGN